jgi:hypothetical protein
MAEMTFPGGNPPPPPTLDQARTAINDLNNLLGGEGTSVNDQNRAQVQASMDVINRFNRASPNNAELTGALNAIPADRRTRIDQSLRAAGLGSQAQDQGFGGVLGEFLNSDIGKLLAGLMSMMGINMEGLQNQFPGTSPAPSPAPPAAMFTPGGPPIAGVVTARTRDGDTLLNTSINNGTIRAFNTDGTNVAAGTQVVLTQDLGGGRIQITQMAVQNNGVLAPVQTPGGAVVTTPGASL